MTLSDSMLHTLCEHAQLVSPFDPELVGPCSIDLTLGQWVRPEGNGIKPFAEKIDINTNRGYILQPGERVLAHSHEVVVMPADKVGKLMLRSTAARMGLEHSFSGLVDPGFGGQLTLELKNDLKEHSIHLEFGMRIVQMSVEPVEGKVLRGYDRVGWYHGQSGATVSNQRIRKGQNARRDHERVWA